MRRSLIAFLLTVSLAPITTVSAFADTLPKPATADVVMKCYRDNNPVYECTMTCGQLQTVIANSPAPGDSVTMGAINSIEMYKYAKANYDRTWIVVTSGSSAKPAITSFFLGANHSCFFPNQRWGGESSQLKLELLTEKFAQ